jgi:transcriptional regulator of arginine metabolism
MSVKTKRLIAIRKILSSSQIGTQEELLEELSNKGFQVTQATLSRDLKMLKVGKMAEAGKGYVYFLPSDHENKTAKSADSRDSFPINGFLSLTFSKGLAVIKTKSGYASSVASLIDSSDCYEIIGTIAGDDTILIIPVEDATHQDIRNALKLIMPDLENKI